MAIRGVSRQELVEHVMSAEEAGYQVDPTWLINETAHEWLTENWPADGNVRPLMEDLPEGLTPTLVTLFAKCRTSEGARAAKSHT